MLYDQGSRFHHHVYFLTELVRKTPFGDIFEVVL